MMRNVLLLFCLVGGLESFVVHKFYLSSTDITYNAKSKNLEIIMKCFIDDFDQALYAYSGKKIYLGTEKEHPKTDSLIHVYLSKHFAIQQEDKDLKIEFLGHESDQDYIWLFLETNTFNKKHTTQITNTVLFESFEEQQNKLRLLVGEQSYSGSCMNNSPMSHFKNN